MTPEQRRRNLDEMSAISAEFEGEQRRAEPLTEAGKRLLGREAYNSRSFALIRAEDVIAIEAEARAQAVHAGVEVLIGGLGWRLFELDDATGWRCIDDEAGIVVDGPTPTAAIAAALARVAEGQG